MNDMPTTTTTPTITTTATDPAPVVDVRGLYPAEIEMGPAGGKWMSLVLVRKDRFDSVVYRGDPSSLPALPGTYQNIKFFLVEGDLLPMATIDGAQYYMLTKQLAERAGVEISGAFVAPVNMFGTMFEPGLIPVKENFVGASEMGLVFAVMGIFLAVVGLYIATKKKKEE